MADKWYLPLNKSAGFVNFPYFLDVCMLMFFISKGGGGGGGGGGGTRWVYNSKEENIDVST